MYTKRKSKTGQKREERDGEHARGNERKKMTKNHKKKKQQKNNRKEERQTEQHTGRKAVKEKKKQKFNLDHTKPLQQNMRESIFVAREFAQAVSYL